MADDQADIEKRVLEQMASPLDPSLAYLQRPIVKKTIAKCGYCGSSVTNTVRCVYCGTHEGFISPKTSPERRSLSPGRTNSRGPR